MHEGDVFAAAEMGPAPADERARALEHGSAFRPVHAFNDRPIVLFQQLTDGEKSKTGCIDRYVRLTANFRFLVSSGEIFTGNGFRT